MLFSKTFHYPANELVGVLARKAANISELQLQIQSVTAQPVRSILINFLQQRKQLTSEKP